MSLVRRISKNQEVFFGKTCSRVFGAPGCNPSILIDLPNNALAIIGLVEPICLISEGQRTHRGVTSPMNFKKKYVFSVNPAPGFSGLLVAIQAP